MRYILSIFDSIRRIYLSKLFEPFEQPIYITRPLLPPLVEVYHKLDEIWGSKWLTNFGGQHIELEKRLKKYLKVPYLSLFNNGTTALLVAIRSLGLSGEVITTSFTFPATINALHWSCIKPVFCDVDPNSLNIDPNQIENHITKKTTGILAVHTFGNMCNVENIQNIANKYNLRVIYDSAHAFGTEVDNNGIGNFGDVSMFSFHATKLFHTAEGGALTLQSSGLKQKLDLMKNFGIKNEDEVISTGINGKMNEIQAGLGLVVLDHIENERKKRKSLKKLYIEKLHNINGIRIISEDEKQTKESLQYFVIKIDSEKFGKSRNEVYNELKLYNVFTRKYFYPLCSTYPHYKDLISASAENLPVASQIAEEVLCLPFYGELGKDAVNKICDIIISLSG